MTNQTEPMSPEFVAWAKKEGLIHESFGLRSSWSGIEVCWLAYQAGAEAEDETRTRMADLLTRTANALRGEPEPLSAHSWHDLPERAAAAIATIGVMQKAAAMLAAAPVQEGVSEGWRCFHCGDVFTDADEAQDHFGTIITDVPACRLAPDLAGLVKIIRQQESELRAHRGEETESFREFYRLGAKHSAELREEEEKGYARGLADAQKHPEEIGLQRVDTAPSPPAAEPWQPIETAPKDGTHILVCRYVPGVRFSQIPPTVVHWHDDGFYTSVNEIGPQWPYPATHWMSLPQPPTTGEAK